MSDTNKPAPVYFGGTPPTTPRAIRHSRAWIKAERAWKRTKIHPIAGVRAMAQVILRG